MTIELQELRHSVRRVLEAGGLAAAPEQTWLQFIELGWQWVVVPEALDGLGAGVQGGCVLLHELGRCLTTAPCLPAMLAMDVLCQSESIERKMWIERATGGSLFAVPLSTCELRQEQGHLHGKIAAVQAALVATHVLAWTADHATIGLIPCNAVGASIMERAGWDETRALCDIHLADVASDALVVLAEGEQAQRLILRFLNQRDFALAAESLGSANAFLEQTIAHLQTRVQFGRPLALFQALKHRCADMKAALAAAEALLDDALPSDDSALETAEIRLRAMGAKMLATNVFAQMAEECLQLHGGIGMASEHSSHLFLKRALLNQHLAAHSNVYAAEIAAHFLSRTIPFTR